MRIAICEDSRRDLDRIHGILTKYLLSNNISAKLDFFCCGEDFLAEFEPEKYQIIFMDIMMREDGMTGMEAAEKVAEVDSHTAIIFTTNNENYSIAGYAVAVYYILKPVTAPDLERAMKKCYAILERYAQTIEITVNRDIFSIRLQDIYYIEALQRTCVFRTKHGEYTTISTFSGILNKLDTLPFVKCHRSYIVNLSHVVALTGGDFITTAHHKVPVSRGYTQDMQKIFKDFLISQLRNGR